MSLVIIQNTDSLMPMRDLARLVTKWIFNNGHCAPQDLHSINRQFEVWTNHLDSVEQARIDMWGKSYSDNLPIGKKGTWADNMRYMLGIMAQWLVMDEKDEWRPTKESWKLHKIDYRKTAQFGWLFPEMYTKNDFTKAQGALKKAMEANPEDYKPSK